MSNPTDLYGVAGAAGIKGDAWAGNSNDRAYPASFQPRHPAACDAYRVPLAVAWHSLCAQCFSGAQLFLAIKRYRAAVR